MIDRLFVYGTLEIPEVLRAVTGRDFPAHPAVLADYRRALLRGEVFSAIVHTPGGSTPGTLYSKVDPDTFLRLDRFEGDPFQRIEVTVQTLSAPSRPETAFVYALDPARGELLGDQPWDRARFEREHLQEFLGTLGARFARGRAPESP